MSKIIAEFQGTSYFTSSIGGAVRWSAPELYRVYEDHIFPVVTVECDIYSFGSVTLQVCINQFFSSSRHSLVLIKRWVDNHWTSAILLHQIGPTSRFWTSQRTSSKTSNRWMDVGLTLGVCSTLLVRCHHATHHIGCSSIHAKSAAWNVVVWQG